MKQQIKENLALLGDILEGDDGAAEFLSPVIGERVIAERGRKTADRPGAGHLKIGILPLMKPAFAAMAIFVGMTSWNNYLWPLLVLKDSKIYPADRPEQPFGPLWKQL